MKDYHTFYDEVYGQDNPQGDAHGWIQWKGTDVCIDLHCKCGYHGHVDGEFFYYYKCPECQLLFAVGQNVKLIELNEEQRETVEKEGLSILTSDKEE